MQVTATVNQDQLKRMLSELRGFEHELPRHLRTAVSKTGKSVRVKIAQALGKVMYLKNNFDPKFKKAETLKKSMARKVAPTDERPSVTLLLSGGYPFNLVFYNARPFVKKRKKQKDLWGVKYTFKPTAEYGRKGLMTWNENEAFMIPQYGHKVYHRKGRRLHQAKGPAPGDYYKDIGAIAIAQKVATEQLPKEIQRRIHAIVMQKKGIVKLKASRGR